MRATSSSISQRIHRVEVAPAQVLTPDQTQLNLLLAYIEQETELAFLAYFSTKEDLPGPEWDHITVRLQMRWQNLESAYWIARNCLGGVR